MAEFLDASMKVTAAEAEAARWRDERNRLAGLLQADGVTSWNQLGRLAGVSRQALIEGFRDRVEDELKRVGL